MKSSLLISYLLEIGVPTLALFMLSNVASKSCDIFKKHWLTTWTNEQFTANSDRVCYANTTVAYDDIGERQYRVAVYATVGIIQGLCQSLIKY